MEYPAETAVYDYSNNSIQHFYSVNIVCQHASQQKSLQIWTNMEFHLNIKMDPSAL